MDDVAVLVLMNLANDAKHGYAMQRDIAHFADRRLGPGTLYGAIARLEEAGLIEALPDDERGKPYAMTDHGRTELVSRLEAMRRVVKEGTADLHEIARVLAVAARTQGSVRDDSGGRTRARASAELTRGARS